MRHSEQRRHAEDLGQVCSEAGEHKIGQQDFLLHFLGDVIHRSGVGQVEQRPSLGERCVCILNSCGGRIVRDKGER